MKKTRPLASNRKAVKTKIKLAGFNLPPIVIILGALCVALTIYIIYRISMTDRKIFSVSLLALFAGLLFETFRITDNWKYVIYEFIGAYFFSLLYFWSAILGEGFEKNIQMWLYCFIFLFSLATAIFNRDKVTTKLTEGITLLQSLSITYWIIDYGFINIDNWFAKVLLVIALGFALFSLVQALTYFILSKTVRLILSVWSSIIMLAFAIDNIYGVYQNEDIETTTYLSQGIYVGLQYFLLGISAIYITHNYMLLASFLPSKKGDYKNELKEIKKDHIDRYSDKQVLIGHAVLCIVYALVMYGLNYKYQILPRYTMIWLVFFTFPLIIQLMNPRLKEGENYV